MRWVAILVAFGLLTGCASAPLPGAPGTSAPAAPGVGVDAKRLRPLPGTPAPKLPVTVRSDDGRDVTVTDVSRIVPLSGGLSELVFSLGLGRNVVAKDRATTFQEADGLPSVSGTGHDIATEGVFSVRPTVILAQEDTGPPEVLAQLKGSGIPVVVINAAWNLGDVAPRMTKVAAALGVADAGRDLLARTAAEIKTAQSRVPAGAAKPKVAFLYLRGTAGVYLLGGKGSGADSLIEAAGAVDVGTSLGKGTFTPITSEAMITARPEVLLVMGGGLRSVGGIDGLVGIAGIAQTPAGERKRVIEVEDGVLLNFGPRTAQVLDLLVDRIHRR
ncbi:heme/hemin ABC transporter substrate-binding protein [Allokutzneria multivorans]|uniref:heme/hemin ABC transporter substrate-binding protein n=1 Tax=Allokutzneria multivorans TaxID=1142134 RepID=UPI0031F16145